MRVAVHRLRRRYGELLRTEIAATVDEPGEVDDEIRDLFAALGHDPLQKKSRSVGNISRFSLDPLVEALAGRRRWHQHAGSAAVSNDRPSRWTGWRAERAGREGPRDRRSPRYHVLPLPTPDPRSRSGPSDDQDPLRSDRRWPSTACGSLCFLPPRLAIVWRWRSRSALVIARRGCQRGRIRGRPPPFGPGGSDPLPGLGARRHDAGRGRPDGQVDLGLWTTPRRRPLDGSPPERERLPVELFGSFPWR